MSYLCPYDLKGYHITWANLAGKCLIKQTYLLLAIYIYNFFTIRHYTNIIIYYHNMKPKPTRWSLERRPDPIPRSREREGGREREKLH
jgi:hypothetical protein